MSEQIMAQVEQVNALLLSGEPGNVSVDDYSHYSGYRPQHIIDNMNTVFGIGAWGFEEVSSEIAPGESNGLAIAQVRVWLKDVEFQPAAWGQSRITRGDIGDAKKGAQTDAIKKALSYFSIGNRAYHGLLNGQGHSAPPQAQNDAAALPNMIAKTKRRALALDLATSPETWTALLQETLGEVLRDEDLTPSLLGKVNSALSRIEKARQQGRKAS